MPKASETKVDSQSSLTNESKRIDEVEAALLRTNDSIGKLSEQLATLTERLNQPPKMPTVQNPDDRLAAMRAAQPDGNATYRMNSVDLRRPNDARTGLQPGAIVRVAETSPKYPAYQLDADNEPVKQIYEYQCQACANTEPCPRGLNGAQKKVCQSCKSTMERKPTGRYEDGTPAYGQIISYMYTSRKGQRKYKVHFEKFSENQRAEGMTESELVLC